MLFKPSLIMTHHYCIYLNIHRGVVIFEYGVLILSISNFYGIQR